MENFTPVTSLIGGVLIGLSATLLLLFNGRIAGISGIMHGMINAPKKEIMWRFLFLLGLVVGGLMFHVLAVEPKPTTQAYPQFLLVLGGFLVGFGARMGNGCTSGHAVCGIANFSIRSIVATLSFMATGMMTVFVIRHILELTT